MDVELGFNFPEEIKILADGLKREGFHSQVDRLLDTHLIGATGTEVLMGGRWVIGKFGDEITGISEDLVSKMESLIRKIDIAWVGVISRLA